MQRRLEGLHWRQVVGAVAAATVSLLGGCSTGTLTEQRRESIDRHLGSIHYLQLDVLTENEMQIDSKRPMLCLTDEVQSLASPVFATSGQRTAELLEHFKDMLRICQGCAVKAAGVAVWQPDIAPAIARHSTALFNVEGRVIYDTDLAREERYRTREAPGGLAYSGTAVPITPDGYFLTAAHVVDTAPRKPLGLSGGHFAGDEGEDGSAADPGEARAAWVAEDFHVACMTVDGQPTLARARVVWRSAPGTSERRSARLSDAVPDLAIFHADIQPARVAAFAKAEAVKPDLLVVGGRALYFTDFSGSTFPHCAGSISELDVVTRDGRRFTRLLTTAPSAPGDSGGPMVTTHGHLVGITTSSGQLFDGRWVSIAWMLPEAEIRAVVDADRQLRAGK